MSDFDYGMKFAPAGERVKGERERREEESARAMPYNVGFLDDLCRNILPSELVLIGARSGAGKTELAKHIAASNARRGRHVHLFALEAYEGEMETRIKYELVARFAKEKGRAKGLNYPDWYRCKFPHLDVAGQFAEEWMGRNLKTLHTYYRDSSFTTEDLRRLLLAIQDETDLVILDHLHYVDLDDDKSETTATKRLVKTLRDTALSMRKAVICIAHLRKQGSRRTLVPEMEEFHGSSDITKIATTVVMLARAKDAESADPDIGNTYFTVPKNRMAGASPYVAKVGFNLVTKRYAKGYMLGRTDMMGETWELLPSAEVPAWAKNAQNAKRERGEI